MGRAYDHDMEENSPKKVLKYKNVWQKTSGEAEEEMAGWCERRCKKHSTNTIVEGNGNGQAGWRELLKEARVPLDGCIQTYYFVDNEQLNALENRKISWHEFIRKLIYWLTKYYNKTGIKDSTFF